MTHVDGATTVDPANVSDWTTKRLGVDADYLAPDQSSIRLLAELPSAGLCLCELPAGATSARVQHKTVDELWYVVSGIGEITRSRGEARETTRLAPGTSLTIPQGVAFQFRCIGGSPLQIVIASAPRWPGADEAQVLASAPMPERSDAGSPDSTTPERWLVELNEKLGEAERTKDTAWLERVLSNDLNFRRANEKVETVVDKATYIAQLADRHYDTLESSDIRVCVYGSVAIVTLVVRAAGNAAGNAFGGLYTNIRVFRAADIPERWQLVRWYNVPIEVPARPPSANETYRRILGKENTGNDDGLRFHTLNHLYEVIWNQGVLCDRDRRLVTLALLAAQGADNQLREHLQGARAAGMSREELLETMIQVAHYAGWARGTAAQAIVFDVFGST